MSGYQVIARKYRPRTFDEVVGQEAVARTLRNAIAAERVAHAYMFCGPRGVGKTSMARILARALNCLAHAEPTTDPCGTCDLCVRAAVGEDLDVMEIDAASNRKVDDARTLVHNVSFHPTRARFKVYVVDEVHMLTTEAFNALLKTLEEPPPHVKFVFATTDPQKVPATILSRCQRFDFRPVPAADIAKLLASICAAEGHTAEPEALAAVARAAVGGMRDAQSLLEQLATLGGGKVRLEDLHALLGTVPGERMRALFDRLCDGDAAGALALSAEVLDGGTDPAELLRQCMRHAHELMLVRMQGARGADVLADAATRAALERQAKGFSEATLVYAVTLLAETLKNARLLGEGRLFAETAIARLAGHRDLRYLDQIARELKAAEERLGPEAPPGDRQPSAPRRLAAAPAPAPSPTPVPVPAPPRIHESARDESRRELQGDEPQASAASPADGRVDGGVVVGGDVGGDVDVRARWADVREAVRSNSRLRAALQPALVEEVRGDTVVLSFPAAAAFHRATVEDPDQMERLTDALAGIAGRRVRVETRERADAVSDEPSERPPPPADISPDRLSAAEVASVREAPLTKLVEERLGGRIVHVERDRAPLRED